MEAQSSCGLARLIGVGAGRLASLRFASVFSRLLGEYVYGECLPMTATTKRYIEDAHWPVRGVLAESCGAKVVMPMGITTDVCNPSVADQN